MQTSLKLAVERRLSAPSSDDCLNYATRTKQGNEVGVSYRKMNLYSNIGPRQSESLEGLVVESSGGHDVAGHERQERTRRGVGESRLLRAACKRPRLLNPSICRALTRVKQEGRY